MAKEDIICVTKKSVDNLIGILDKTIDLLEINSEAIKTHMLLSKKEDTKSIRLRYEKNQELMREAKSEREIYKKVKTTMENRGHMTLCLSSESPKSTKK